MYCCIGILENHDEETPGIRDCCRRHNVVFSWTFPDLKVNGQTNLALSLAAAARRGDVCNGSSVDGGGMPPLSRTTRFGLRCCSPVATACHSFGQESGFREFPPETASSSKQGKGIVPHPFNLVSHHIRKPAPARITKPNVASSVVPAIIPGLGTPPKTNDKKSPQPTTEIR